MSSSSSFVFPVLGGEGPDLLLLGGLVRKCSLHIRLILHLSVEQI